MRDQYAGEKRLALAMLRTAVEDRQAAASIVGLNQEAWLKRCTERDLKKITRKKRQDSPDFEPDAELREIVETRKRAELSLLHARHRSEFQLCTKFLTTETIWHLWLDLKPADVQKKLDVMDGQPG
jgi:hypothetical protein